VYNLGLTSSDEDEAAGDDQEKGDFLKDSSAEEEDANLLDDEDDDDDDDEEIMGKRDNDYGIPDSRAWGKKAKVFHNTDYVDQDFGGFEGSDAEMAELEEAEAKEIQKRLTAELDEEDFLGFIPVQPEKVKKSAKTKEILKVDFDHLSVAEKRKLVQRECPELIHMIDEYKGTAL
jgi:U3 small nucleolar RNA-associated protein 3